MAEAMTGTRVRDLILLAACCMVLAPAASKARRNDDSDIVVGPIGGETTESITRTGLEESIRRFADRFYTRVTQVTDTIRDAENQNPETRLLMHQWKTVSAQTIVELAIGQDAVTNLLDMMVLTRLSRLMIEGYWARSTLTPEDGRAMSETYATLETDIWDIGADILTPEQLDDMRDLIDGWYRDNPDQRYPWYIRLDEFSGQRAATIQSLRRRGASLLGIREARESVEQVQEFAERALFDGLVTGQEKLITRLYIVGSLLILTFFACLIGYRILMAKTLGNPSRRMTVSH